MVKTRRTMALSYLQEAQINAGTLTAVTCISTHSHIAKLRTRMLDQQFYRKNIAIATSAFRLSRKSIIDSNVL